MRTAIFKQKSERDRLLAQPYLQRHVFCSFETLLSNHNIKLITGPRRAGKSTQALMMLKGRNFAYLNFDDNSLLEGWNEDLVMSLLDEIYPGYEFLLLDEIQNIAGWDIWVSKLYRRGVNMVITGSNANMLSGEMATVLTGRYLEINVLPFSLNETFEWNNLDINHISEERYAEAQILADDYLRNGGYPESVVQRPVTGNYLSTLFDSTIYKDVVRRHKVRNVSELNDLASFLLSNFTNPLSYNDVGNHLGLNSVTTVKKFMDYLHEPYLFYYLPRFNNKLRLMNKAPKKVYVVDNGFVTSRAFNLSENLGRLLENQVFVDFLRRGYDVRKSIFYYRSRNDKEVDFVLRRGTAVERLVQVCYDISDKKTLKREVDSLVECAGELRCSDLCIITNSESDTIEKDGYRIQVIPVTSLT